MGFVLTSLTIKKIVAIGVTKIQNTDLGWPTFLSPPPKKKNRVKNQLMSP